MTCTSARGPIASTGKMFYNGDTAHGEVKVNTQGMLMTSKMSGKGSGLRKDRDRDRGKITWPFRKQNSKKGRSLLLPFYL